MLLDIVKIEIGKRLRQVSDGTVADLAESISTIGLQVPITVSTGIKKVEGTSDQVRYTLIAGMHRLAACKQLGWHDIETNVVDLSPDECDLWEIDENLCRADLSQLERGEHLLKRKAIYERLNPQARQGVAGGIASARAREEEMRAATTAPQGAVADTFKQATAARLNTTSQYVGKVMNRVDKIAPVVRERIRGMLEIADNGEELAALSRLEPKEQRKAVALVEAGQAGSIRDAKKLIEAPSRPVATPNNAHTLAERRFNALMKAWNDADAETRQRFLDAIDKPVADNTTALRVV